MKIVQKKFIYIIGTSIIAIFAFIFWGDISKNNSVTTITVNRAAFMALPKFSQELNQQNQSPTATLERTLLPDVMEVERWEQIAGPISGADNFAPGMIALQEGGYRIYWNDYSLGGITSATSSDGITFTKDEGVRITKVLEGSDCIASHPWLVALKNGYRMYYGGFCRYDTPMDPQIFSAFSADGMLFYPEGVVVDSGDETGLTFAGHGRILSLDDGTYRMYFSANTYDMQSGDPSAILGASSSDGIQWTLDDNIMLEMGHDPAIVWRDGKAHMYASFLSKNTIHLVSDDGYNFSVVAWMEFYDSTGKRFEEFGDVEALVTDEGITLIYGGGKLEGAKEGNPGLVIMKEV